MMMMMMMMIHSGFPAVCFNGCPEFRVFSIPSPAPSGRLNDGTDRSRPSAAYRHTCGGVSNGSRLSKEVPAAAPIEL